MAGLEKHPLACRLLVEWVLERLVGAALEGSNLDNLRSTEHGVLFFFVQIGIAKFSTQDQICWDGKCGKEFIN